MADDLERTVLSAGTRIKGEVHFAGPACVEAATPVKVKMPAPIMAPMPNATNESALRLRFSPCSPSASASSASIGLVAKRLTVPLSWLKSHSSNPVR